MTKEKIKKGILLKKKEFNFEKLRKILNKERNDCLHIACKKDNAQVVDTIMRAGHKVNKEAVNKQRMNALHVAVKSSMYGQVESLGVCEDYSVTHKK